MARVFITGSSDGLGLRVAKLLVDEGHDLVPQGRNEARRKSRKVACDRVLDVRRRATRLRPSSRGPSGRGQCLPFQGKRLGRASVRALR